MEFINMWRQVLIPEAGFHVVDLWQVLVVLALLIFNSRKFGFEDDETALPRYSPLYWIKKNISFLITWGCIVFLYLICAQLIGLEVPVFHLFTYLGGAWTIIGLLCSLLKERFWAESVATVLYLGVTFSILVLARESLRFLEDIKFSIGNNTVSAWHILAGMIALIFTFWISLALSKLIEKQIHQTKQLSGSLKVLIAKIIRIIFFAIAGYIVLESLGINLSAFAVLGGAIGLGLGFGLQKVISNFVSGIILLLDNSIKPGDVIEIDGTYGWINNLRARYASVITRDGTEHLIPNEDLITQRVINWSFTDNLVRIRIPIGVSYKADPHQCIALVLEATKSMPRVLSEPAPNCLLVGFGDSSVDLELRLWIADPSNGVGSVQSAVLLKIWDTFKENNIEIPFPQRDVHIRTSDVKVVPRDLPDPS